MIFRHLITHLSIFITALMLCSSAQAESTMEQLYRLSGLQEQVAALPSSVKAGFKEAVQRLPSTERISPQQIDALEHRIETAFNDRELSKFLNSNLKSNLDTASVKAALKWFSTPAGQRVTAAETAASMPHTQAALANFANEMVNRALPSHYTERVRIIKEATNATDKSVEMAMKMQTAITSALITATPEGAKKLPYVDLQFRNSRSMVEKQVSQYVDSAMMYTYKNISQKDLDNYIEFVTSKPGKNYARAVLNSIAKTLDSAIKILSRELTDLAKQWKRR